jgi:23S rRNA G2445 N2-methylase RlmL
VSGFADAQIGAAARVVHDGCRKAIREHFPLEPVRAEEEGSKVRIEKGFDAHAVRLTGNVTGEAPFTGTLAHRGWRVKEVKLPRMTEGHDATVVAPAEVEV